MKETDVKKFAIALIRENPGITPYNLVLCVRDQFMLETETYIDNGIEKYVAIFPEWGFVLKITDRTTKYEYNIYRNAKKYGIQEVFLRAYNPFKIGGIIGYFQEYANEENYTPMIPRGDDGDERVRECVCATTARPGHRRSKRNGIDIYRRCDLPLVIYQLYGYEFLETLTDFLVRNHINDLHGNNFTYLNRQPKILDYSGY